MSAASGPGPATPSPPTPCPPDADATVPDRNRQRSRAEDTELERRVLAQERVLQSLIAHLAESEPSLLDKLNSGVGDANGACRQEQVCSETAPRAEQPIGAVTRVGAQPVAAGREATMLQVVIRRSLWRIMKNGSFHGDYLDRSRAEKAVNAAVLEIVRGGGTVQVSWPQPRDDADR